VIHFEISWKMKNLLRGICFLATLLTTSFASEPMAVTVDCSRPIRAFERDLAFGVNALGKWDKSELFPRNAWRFQQLGARLIRYPGGTNANEHHWNGDGYYDADHIWHDRGSPRITTFSPGFYNAALHRGSTVMWGGGSPAKLTDSDRTTEWLSYPGDGNRQWVYLDVSTAERGAARANRIVIEWGSPYATKFKLQYSKVDTSAGPYAYTFDDTAWTDLTGTLEGSGAKTDFTFEPVEARFIRVCCLASSSSENQYAIREIELYDGAARITRNQNDSGQTVTVSSSVALGDVPQSPGEMNFEQFVDFLHAVGPDMVPLICVNFFTGTPQEAADWVYYANVHRSLKIKYWEVGNEMWGFWEAGGPLGSAAYADRFLKFRDAMMAVDPSIVVMPQFCDAMDPERVTLDPETGKPGRRGYYLENFLEHLQRLGRADVIKAISIHSYPDFMPDSEATVLTKLNQWDTVLPRVRGWIDRLCPNPAEVRIFDTEYNDSSDSAFTNHFYNALFVSGYILNYLRNGGDYACFYNSFGVPGPRHFDKSIASDFGMMDGGALSGARKYQPRSSFFALAMLHNNFSAPDAFGNTLVETTSSDSMVKVYANHRGDGRVSLIFINTDPARARVASIAITGFAPRPVAQMVTYTPANYVWISRGRASYADPDKPPEVGTIEHVGQTFTVDLAPYALEIVTMDDARSEPLAPLSPTLLPASASPAPAR